MIEVKETLSDLYIKSDANSTQDGFIDVYYRHIRNRTILPPESFPIEFKGEQLLALTPDSNSIIIVKPFEQDIKIKVQQAHPFPNSSHIEIGFLANYPTYVLKTLKGLPIVKYFIKGSTGKYLDMLSLFDKQIPNFISFTDETAIVAREREYSGVVYPQQVFLPVPITGNNSWNFDDYKFLFLHENSQGCLNDQYYYSNWSISEYERMSNATAFKIAKKVNNEHPKESFFDLSQMLNWIEMQLQGYDGSSISSLRYAASNKLRKQLRNY